MMQFRTPVSMGSDEFAEMLPRLFARAERKPNQRKRKHHSYENYVIAITPPGYEAPCKLTLSFPVSIRSIDSEVAPHNLDEDLRDFERENIAFQALSNILLQSHQGKFVAIREGKMIDEDFNEINLAQRMERTYRNEFVLIRKVMPEAAASVYLESPEFEIK